MTTPTVRFHVPDSFVYDALHRFEYHPDIDIVDRENLPDDNERWTIQSDRFPPHWNGRFVSVICDESHKGIYQILAPDIHEVLELSD